MEYNRGKSLPSSFCQTVDFRLDMSRTIYRGRFGFHFFGIRSVSGDEKMTAVKQKPSTEIHKIKIKY